MQKKQLTELAQLLVQCRADRNMKLSDVGRETGLSNSWLSDLETGKKARAHRTAVLRLEAFLRKHGYFPKKAVA